MKIIYLIIAGIGFSEYANAQLRDTVFVIPNSEKNNFKFTSQTLPGAKLLSSNNQGKIYSLPLDNMNCLVPDSKNTAPIPVKKLHLQNNGQIPNKTPKLTF